MSSTSNKSSEERAIGSPEIPDTNTRTDSRLLSSTNNNRDVHSNTSYNKDEHSNTSSSNTSPTREMFSSSYQNEDQNTLPTLTPDSNDVQPSMSPAIDEATNVEASGTTHVDTDNPKSWTLEDSRKQMADCFVMIGNEKKRENDLKERQEEENCKVRKLAVEKETQSNIMIKLDVDKKMQKQITFLLTSNRNLEKELETAKDEEALVIKTLIQKNKRNMEKLLKDLD